MRIWSWTFTFILWIWKKRKNGTYHWWTSGMKVWQLVIYRNPYENKSPLKRRMFRQLNPSMKYMRFLNWTKCHLNFVLKKKNLFRHEIDLFKLWWDFWNRKPSSTVTKLLYGLIPNATGWSVQCLCTSWMIWFSFKSA